MSASIDFRGVDESEVPPVRTQVAESICQAMTLQHGWRTWSQTWINESPSWLVSLIFHLVAFLVITSVAVPWSGRRGAGSGEISLTLGFADRTSTSRGPEVTIEPVDSLNASDPTKVDHLGEETPLNEQPAQPTHTSSPTVAPKPSLAASISAAPRAIQQISGGRSAELGQMPAPSLEISPYAALLNRRRPTLGMSTVGTEHRHHNYSRLQPLTTEELSPRERAMDQIVDNFIAYDVGKLRGAAGALARQKFAELGTEAVPALVRGLNKAAGIHASCPVGVIAGKLMSTLQHANDPSLRQYAVEHVGVGVPESAPHFHRLVALQKNWLGAPAMQAKVATFVERLESRQEGELMELMLALSDAPSETIVAALRSKDEYLGAAAALAILQSPQRWDAPQRAQLRAAVSYLQSTTVNPRIQALTVDAHRLLSK